MNWNEIFTLVQRIYPNADPKKLLIQPYCYRTTFANIQPGASATKTLQVSANADFILTAPLYRCSVAPSGSDANGDIVPKILTLLTDTGSNQQFTADQVDISTYFGQIGKAEYNMVFPRVINGNSGITIQVQSYANTDIYDPLELTFSGLLVRGL